METKQDVTKRERKVDVNLMNREDVDVIMEQLGAKVGKEFSDLSAKLKSLLKIYGLDVTIHYVIHPEGENAADYIYQANPETSDSQ